MSRIGRLAVTIPEGVTVTIGNHSVSASGPKGSNTLTFSHKVMVSRDGEVLHVELATTDKKATALQGLTVRLLQNLLVGVAEGFTRTLEINGVGYRAVAQGNTLTLNVGFSHPVILTAPDETAITVAKNIITVSGIDKQVVGQFAAIVRGTKPPEPYKGKGIKYSGEQIRRKAGKAAKATSATA